MIAKLAKNDGELLSARCVIDALVFNTRAVHLAVGPARTAVRSFATTRGSKYEGR